MEGILGNVDGTLQLLRSLFVEPLQASRRHKSLMSILISVSHTFISPHSETETGGELERKEKKRKKRGETMKRRRL